MVTELRAGRDKSPMIHCSHYLMRSVPRDNLWLFLSTLKLKGGNFCSLLSFDTSSASIHDTSHRIVLSHASLKFTDPISFVVQKPALVRQDLNLHTTSCLSIRSHLRYTRMPTWITFSILGTTTYSFTFWSLRP